MNRKERRRLERAGQTVKKEPVLQIKANSLDAAVKSRVEAAQQIAKQKAVAAAIHEVNQQLMERDLEYSLDIDAMILWTLHACYGWGKKRLEEFYVNLMNEHTRMREFYEIDDTYPERAKLKAECGIDVEELNRKFQELNKQEEKEPHD